MAVSPAHQFGQEIGLLLEEIIKPLLSDFSSARGLYLDAKGPRGKARSGNKVTWTDKYGNNHDLDFVIERKGTSDDRGRPLAFIESAWRRYTKHSRNKAQEIQGAILPIVENYHWDAPFKGVIFAGIFSGMPADRINLVYECCWWLHILMIFVFANVLPYSKHFHVFMSIPNVFLSRLEPLGKLPNMDSITREVKLMLNPESVPGMPAGEPVIERFGVKDIEDVSWKNYFDSLACTECGRCTSVCPANLTGKLLSPRKIIMNVRARMKEKGPGLVKEGMSYSDKKSLLRDYITEEELWACTTCNACAKECPININHPTLIIDMRRYLVMEEASAPSGIKWIFGNIENNGAAWQFSAEDRLLWAQDLEIHVN